MRKSIIERAFELAPQCGGTKYLRRLLEREGYERVSEHLSGLGFKREHRKLYNQGAGEKKRGPAKRL